MRWQLLIGPVVLAACNTHAPAPTAARPPAPAAPSHPASSPAGSAAFPSLHAVAKSMHAITLVQGRARVALAIGDRTWVTVRDGTLVDDPSVARGLLAGARALPGDNLQYAWGRTPAVFDVRKSPLVGRADGTRGSAPGAMVALAALGDRGEVWTYEDAAHRSALAVVDARDRTRKLPPLPRLGNAVPGMTPEFSTACEQPTVWRLVTLGSDVIAGIVECSIEAPFRVQVIHPDGTTAVRQLASFESAGHLQAEELAVTAHGDPIVAGELPDGTFALALSRDNGSWDVTRTAISAVTVAGLVVAADDAPWTVTLGSGPDHHDRWTLARAGVEVEVRDPADAALRPMTLAYDAQLGIVVEANDGNVDHPTWVLAEHPPASPVLDLP